MHSDSCYRTLQPGAHSDIKGKSKLMLIAKNECLAGGSTVTLIRVEAGGKGEHDQDMAQCREKKDIGGGPSKDTYVAGGSIITMGKVEAGGGEEQ